jgi:hypothetical protein
MCPILNNRQADQLFLEACFHDDRAALDLWIAHSYHVEVAQGMKAAADWLAPGQLRRDDVVSLVVVCTSAIYKEHAKLPSRFRSLKTMVRNFAYAFMVNYLRERWKHQRP